MLDRESQRLDLQEVWLTQESIDIDVKGVCGELGIQPGTQTPERVGVVHLDMELFGQLTVHGFDNLTHCIDESLQWRRHLPLLMGARQGMEPDTVVAQELGRLVRADVAFAADDLENELTRQLALPSAAT